MVKTSFHCLLIYQKGRGEILFFPGGEATQEEILYVPCRFFLSPLTFFSESGIAVFFARAYLFIFIQRLFGNIW